MSLDELLQDLVAAVSRFAEALERIADAVEVQADAGEEEVG